jgi:hypothetical protein
MKSTQDLATDARFSDISVNISTFSVADQFEITAAFL